jgi:hypothetical protein
MTDQVKKCGPTWLQLALQLIRVASIIQDVPVHTCRYDGVTTVPNQCLLLCSALIH